MFSRLLFLAGVAPRILRPPYPPGFVLFLGNSLLWHRDIPWMVQYIARKTGHPATCRAITRRDGTLHDLSWELPRIAFDRQRPADFRLVLQDNSRWLMTPDGARRSLAAMARFAAEARSTVIMEPWPRAAGHTLYAKRGMPAGPEEMAERLAEVSASQARAIGAEVAPLGRAWLAATRVGIHLYANDGYHANHAGAWLSALILARVLGVPSPIDAPVPPIVPQGPAAALGAIARETYETL